MPCLLFLAWKSLDSHDLNLMFSSHDGDTFEGKTSFASSDMGPALASHNGNLFIAWHAVGTDYDNLKVAQIQLISSVDATSG